MTKSKKPEPRPWKEQEYSAQPGETRKSKQVFDNIGSAWRQLGDGLKIEEIISQVGLDDVDELEGAYVQKRLRKELGLQLPADLRFDESVLSAAKIEKRGDSDESKTPIMEDKNAEPPVEVSAEYQAELVEDLVRELQRQFSRAETDGSEFSIREAMKSYTEGWGEEAVKQILDKLEQAGVTDLKEGGEEIEESKIEGRPPKDVELIYENGEFYVKPGGLYRNGYPEKKKHAPKILNAVARELGLHILVDDHPDQLSRILKGLQEIHKDTYSVKAVPVYRGRKTAKEGEPDLRPIDDFEAVFYGRFKIIKDRSGRDRKRYYTESVPKSEAILARVNAKQEELRQKVARGENLKKDDRGRYTEGYWDAEEVSAWRDSEAEKIKKEYIREKIKRGIKSLGLELPVAKSAPAGAGPDRFIEDKELKSVEPSEKLTPADVGMNAEVASKAKEAGDVAPDESTPAPAETSPAVVSAPAASAPTPAVEPLPVDIAPDASAPAVVVEPAPVSEPPADPGPGSPVVSASAPVFGPEYGVKIGGAGAATPEERGETPKPSAPTAGRKEAEKRVAREAVISARQRLRETRDEIEKTKTELKKYDGILGRLRAGLPGGDLKHKDLLTKLEELEGSALEKAQAELNRAEQRALRVGVVEDESCPTVPGRLFAPEQQAGESAEEYLKRWARIKDGLKSGVFAIPKFVWAIGSVYIGARVFETGTRFFQERSALKKHKKAFQDMVGELEKALRDSPAGGDGEGVRGKAQAIEQKVNELINAGQLKTGDKQRFLDNIHQALGQSARERETAQQDINQAISRVLDDYFQRKATAIELGKQTLNTALLLSGWQFGRAITYGGLTVLQRAMRARADAERERGLSTDEKEKAWNTARDKGVIKNLTVDAVGEYLRQSTGMVWDLVKNEKTTKAEWAKRKMEFGKALSTTMIAAGLAKVAYAELAETGPSAQIDAVLDKIEKDGMATTLGNNWLHNIEQLSFGLVRFNTDGELQVADNPEQGFAEAKPEPAPEPTAKELIQKAEDDFFKAHPEYQRLEVASKGAIDVRGQTDGNVRVEMEFKGAVQQELRDVITAFAAVKDGKFDTLEAAHVQNMVANLMHLLNGKDLRFMEAKELDEIAHIGDNKIVIHNGEAWHDLLTKLKTHIEGKVTAGSIEKYDELVATVNNTSDAHWQKDVNVGTGVDSPEEQGYVKVNIDHNVIHQAEVQTAQHITAEFGIKGAQVDIESVEDENNFTIKAGDQAMVVKNGQIGSVMTIVDGARHTYPLAEPIDIYDGYAGSDIKYQSTNAYEEAMYSAGKAVGGGTAEAAVDSVDAAAAPGAPDTFEKLIATQDRGGLVQADGRIHFGDVKFTPDTLDKVDEQSVAQFIKEPWEKLNWVGRHSEAARGLEKLAGVMGKHPDSGTVGEYIVKYQKSLEGWLREV